MAHPPRPPRPTHRRATRQRATHRHRRTLGPRQHRVEQRSPSGRSSPPRLASMPRRWSTRRRVWPSCWRPGTRMTCRRCRRLERVHATCSPSVAGRTPVRLSLAALARLFRVAQRPVQTRAPHRNGASRSATDVRTQGCPKRVHPGGAAPGKAPSLRDVDAADAGARQTCSVPARCPRSQDLALEHGPAWTRTRI